MDLRKSILSAVLLAVGFILHQIIPTFGGVTFDIQLAMLFVIIAINMDFKNTVVVSLASGIITALTTKMPGGQVGNMVDKAITGLVVYLLLMALSKVVNKNVAVAITGFIGTIVSGSIFLATVAIFAGLPMSFAVMFMGVVLPTAAANTFLAPLLYNAVNMSKKAAGLEI